jgi:predicted amidohydrolase YtcJ
MLLRVLVAVLLCLPAPAADADLILHNGKVVTVDAAFRVVESIAIKGGRITATGTSAAILRGERTPRTRVVDLGGKTVLPGLIDAHVHALEAGLSEFRAPLPVLDSIAAIQNYIRAEARSRPAGSWIVVPRTLPPRLKEMRFPTKQDLDVITDHPVAFDGSYVWGSNSLGLKISGITRDTPNPPGGEIVKGPDGEPNGILRNASQLLKGVARSETFSDEDKLAALGKMLQLYAAAGLTAVGDRAVTPAEVAIYEKLKSREQLPVRVILTWRINAARPVEQIVSEIQASSWTTNQGDDWLRFGTFKVTLDGGQSVGTAYQRTPYGSFGRQLYGQTDPDARGTLFIDPEKLYRIMNAARDKGWQLTAHVQGGGAIDTLLDVFERLDRKEPIAPSRSHVMHGSLMSERALDRMQRMGILVDVQPGWLHFDVPALKRVFGLENMR